MLNLFDGEFGSRETLQFIEEKLDAGIWKWDLASGAMEWSRGFFNLLGLDPGSVKPSFAAIHQMIHPDDRFSGDELNESLQDGVRLERECRIIQPNGRVRWISNRAEALFQSDGRASRIVGLSVDVTKDREQLQHQKNAAARYNALLAAVPGTILIVDNVGNVVRLLKGGEKITHLPAHPRSWLDFVHPDDRASVGLKLAEARPLPSQLAFEHRSCQSDGTFRWMRTVAAPVSDENRVLLEWIHVSTDIDLERRYLPAVTVGTPRLTGAQLRAARGMLAMSVKDLADAAQISPSTIRRYEEIDGPNTPEAALTKLHATLIDAGIEFIFPRAGQPGIRPRSQWL